MASYETFAAIYDEVMDSSLYNDWLEFTKRHMSDKGHAVLELACGTGILSILLANEGYDVTGVDLSHDMIRLADKRGRENKTDVVFKQGDMLQLDDISKYNMVTCYSDSLCYMPNEQAVLDVFTGVHKSLKDDGRFIFDVHSIFQIEEMFKEYSYHYQTDDFAFLWESYPGVNEFSVEHFLTFFIKETDDRFVRVDELHEERTYELDTYISLLQDAGFSSVDICADFTDDAPQDDSTRWFFVCYK
ncbi:class I SAM-dependent DNA methyltransferase [Vagococcus vulneris]|uniref:SAM-dependent methyltransferase n=1 Tax=Vagococcus vulneris TaxID=1977869 RepID=A0A430A183_9ENTE|nr:class I SAM-dependent methyltransferase [Vagococcus vulneris]RSU00156.1 SAM-dependent methyltransferase [Vagococcus vulneris]